MTVNGGINLASELEFNVLNFEAGNLLLVVVVDIGVNRVFTRRDLLGQIDLRLQNHVTLLQRAVEVDIFNLLAEVGGLSDKGDQAILDLQEHGSTLLDSFMQGTRSLDDKSFTRERGVRRQVDRFDIHAVARWVGAVSQRVVSFHGNITSSLDRGLGDVKERGSTSLEGSSSGNGGEKAEQGSGS